ncbi:MAG: SLC13 family permease [Planctomycetota bacterium]|jgi:sodium-dependent dicarboxylate transporter 2/3/5|nr:DASS family sodium-coupled anion symporter [Planctomycetota bacterium]
MNKFTFPSGPLLGLLVYGLLVQIDAFPPLAAAVAALSVWMALWWMTEPVPLELTALLPMIVLPLIGLYPAKSAMMDSCAPYANESVYFFLGGFGLGLAIEKTMLHRIGALFLLRWAGSNASRVVGAFMLSSALLSMWINNTATTMLMLPLAISVIATTDHPNFSKSILIGIAYAASIGGMGTLVGTAPNIYFSGFLREKGMEIGFWNWMLLAMPIVAVLLIGCWIWMVVILWPMKGLSITVPSQWSDEWKSTRSLDWQQRTTLIVFAVAAACWILRTPILELLENTSWYARLSPANDAWIAMTALASLLIFPLGKPVLEWKDVDRIPWGVLLLFGGGLSLSNAISKSGLDQQIGIAAVGLQGIPVWILLTIVVLLVVAISEMASNVATATTMIPILMGASSAMQVDPIVILSATVLASSCGFMMPVATPPNTLVFAQKKFPVKDMLIAGFGVNLLAILAIPPAVLWILPKVLTK